jgi:transglutaminase-like putative cysteine protease
MTFESLYRISMYVMLFLAALVFSIDATGDNPLAMLYPPAVALAGVVAFLTVDRNPRFGLSRPLAFVLILGTVVLWFAEWKHDENLFLLAGAHLLVYIVLIEMFTVKTHEVDWLLFLLGVVQVLVGSVLSQSDAVGLALFAWALSALWVLGLFYLHREAERQRQWAAAGLTITPEPSASEPYPNLIDGPFVLAALRGAVLALALGGVIFLLMPRQRVMGQTRKGTPLAKHLTGFDDEVRLGQLGEVLENDSVVMSVELFDGEGNRIKPDPDREPLWRGVTMGVYENGRWLRAPHWPTTFSITARRQWPASRTIVQKIRLEPTDIPVLFALRPMLDANAGERLPPEMNQYDGTIERPETTTTAYNYEVVSAAAPDALQPGESLPVGRYRRQMLQVPEPLGEHLRKIAEPIVASIPADDHVSRAHALELWLRETGGFGYTLQMGVTDPNIDPIEDFLSNRKQGHCAYFASALTLLLRSIGIPARMVNGFKGGDWNELASVVSVRQKHAHTWVEAYIGPSKIDSNTLPHWLALDPTPSREREEVVARVGGVPPNVRQLNDFIRYIWLFYIVGFDAERQNRVVYEPIRQLARAARSGFLRIGAGLSQALGWLFTFHSVSAFFSVRGFFVTFFALLLLAGLGWLARWLVLRLWRWLRGEAPDEAAGAAGVAFYRRLIQLLAEFSLERTAAETPREFARRAAHVLAGPGSEGEPVAEVPGQIVDAFYHVRFGHRTLTPGTLQHLENQLDALEANLRQRTPGSMPTGLGRPASVRARRGHPRWNR